MYVNIIVDNITDQKTEMTVCQTQTDFFKYLHKKKEKGKPKICTRPKLTLKGIDSDSSILLLVSHKTEKITLFPTNFKTCTHTVNYCTIVIFSMQIKLILFVNKCYKQTHKKLINFVNNL